MLCGDLNGKEMQKKEIYVMYTYGGFTSLYGRNWHNIVKQLCCGCCWLVAQSCLTLCDPMDCSPPGASVREIFQAGSLEWVAISYSRGSSWVRDHTCISCIFCICRWILHHCATWEVWEKSLYLWFGLLKYWVILRSSTFGKLRSWHLVPSLHGK